MKIERKAVTVGDLVNGYVDNKDDGVVAFGGNLDVRPAYQREFIYNEKQRNAVMDTVKAGLPLNISYWVDNGAGQYEVLDGQQRTISICQYIDGGFSHDGHFFDSLPQDEKDAILAYDQLFIFVCNGTESQKLAWFDTINMAGVKLTAQELRNAVYTGEWLSCAKQFFSKRGCVGETIGKAYIKGSPIKQDYLEEALSWMGGDIESYMSDNRHTDNANELIDHYKRVIGWIRETFPKNSSVMRGLKWGDLYSDFSCNSYDSDVLSVKVANLMSDEDVTKKSGIYAYVLGGCIEQKHLNIRAFSEGQRQTVYSRQAGMCAIRGINYPIGDMEADHITPWIEGGQTDIANCQMIHKDENRRKGSK